jgi:CDP-glycerol glycerophosphotransferase (TagB/SpsB family)
MNHLMAEFPNSNSLEWNRDSDNFDVLRRSDILISDFSGIVYDYSLVYRKPVIYADVEFDDSPYDAWWLDTPFWPIASLPKIGKQLTKDNMQNLKELIDSCIESTEYKNNIDSLIEETWQYKGEGAVRTADYIVNKYNELTEKNKANL